MKIIKTMVYDIMGKWAKDMYKWFMKKTQMINKCEKMLNSTNLREIQMTTIMEHHFTPISLAKLNMTQVLVRIQENAKFYPLLENWFNHFRKIIRRIKCNWSCAHLTTQQFHFKVYSLKKNSNTCPGKYICIWGISLQNCVW